jgi:hydroxymethylpyrimidine/phosphomethylpyrimidine kinase
MNLDHVTLPAADYDASLAFYTALGLVQIVAARPRYARFEMPGGSTLSFEVGIGVAGGAQIHLRCADVDAEHARASAAGLVFDYAPRDESYLWRCAGLTDPAGNRIILYDPGDNQRFPPWRLDGRTS